MRRAGAVLALVAGLAAGCGESVDADDSATRFQGPVEAPARVVEEWSRSVGEQDWDHICRDLYTQTKRDLTRGLVSSRCEKEVEKSFGDYQDFGLTVKRATIEKDGTAAIVTEDSGGGPVTFTLKQVDDVWRIDGFSGTFKAD